MNVKKCPECGNPSYDGAPVCGNCGYKFPKPKMVPSKREDIFQTEPKVNKSSNEESTLEIIKEKKLIIGAILLLTIIVICGIFLTGSNNNSSQVQTNDLIEYNAGDFSFNHPGNWEEVNLTDSEHDGAKFFKIDNGTILEHYNVTSDFSSLKEITQNRISYAQEKGLYVDLIETININGIDASNVILENNNGDFTRFVSILNKDELNVFKITGDSLESVTSEDVDSVLNSVKLT